MYEPSATTDSSPEAQNGAYQVYLQRKKEIEKNNSFPENFADLLQKAMTRYGDATALNYFDQGRSLSFVEVYQQVYQIADGLQQIGIKKDSHVAVLLSNRVEYPLTWLALGVLGAVMLPVNTRYTGAEMDYLCNDGDAEFIITESGLLGTVEAMHERPAHITNQNILVMECPADRDYLDFSAVQSDGSADFTPDWKVDGDDLMNIQYTSGTTGFPKGCMQAQRYWILLGCMCGEFLGDIKSILSDHPFFYMDPQWQLIMGLSVGATVNAPSKLSSSRFIERIRNNNVELAFFPRPLISQPAQDSDRDTPLKKLFALGMGADAQRNLSKRFGLDIYEAFGMTEIGPGLMVPEELVKDPNILGTCGVPTPFREAKVALDDNGTEAGVEEVGELWIRGDSILKGYYNKPEANAESFHDGWFKTGDLFIRDQYGYYRIVGRKKDMIRRSSENISALEVEQVFSSHPGIVQAAAVPVADDYRGEEVKVYLLPRDADNPIDPTAILDYCKERLAPFKVPRFISYVTEFPYTPSEKVAKHKLVAKTKNLRANSWDSEQDSWLDELGQPQAAI
ncbi:class I adenylate-forming enzyme family protein [Microbulbifer agarilyticus]